MNRICGILICGIFLISLLLIPQYPVEIYDVSRVSSATRQEVLDFLAQDTISERAYDRIIYNCLNFAVDLWRNAYLEGLDAFLVLLNGKGIMTHVIVGFYATGPSIYGQDHWLDRNGDWWFYVDPPQDCVYSRYHPDDLYGELSDEIITFIYGGDAFALWQEVSNRTLIKDDLVHFYLTIALYKTQKLFNTN